MISLWCLPLKTAIRLLLLFGVHFPPNAIIDTSSLSKAGLGSKSTIPRVLMFKTDQVNTQKPTRRCQPHTV
ncbi:hypothetical protein B0J14DRAFT_585353 [Halenospora varia]|nr:hypothetical protein B0J14DRAFT_585353 [Halenospora varia]